MERESLGPYRLLHLLGRGGMGEVYLARDPRLNRNVALKVLSSVLAYQPEFRERFLLEARSVSALNHPNITVIHEIGEADELHYIAFEFVDGKTLENILEERKVLDPERFFRLVLPMAEALVYAHRKGIVHRDLKPANILISDLGIPKISDFGLAKVLSPMEASRRDEGSEDPTLAKLTQAGMVVGTIAYMSPEQALGQTVDHRSDIFSFGSLMYVMLAGRPAFSGSTPTQHLDELLHKDPVSLDRIRPELAPDLTQTVRKALRKNPEERYQSMEGLLADLRHSLREGESKPVEKVTPDKGTDNRALKNRIWKGISIAAAAVVALLLVGLMFFERSQPAPASSVAVMYFENISDLDDSNNTGRMLASLLASELSGANGLEVASLQKLHDVAKRLGREEGLVDRSIATEVARHSGVGTMVVGRVVRAGDRLVATTELVDVATGRSLASQKAEGRGSEDVFLIAEQLSEQVREDLKGTLLAIDWASPPEGSIRNLTESVDAYRAYVQGESLLQRAEFEGAADEFEEAVRIDPEFALAHFRLSIAARWLSDGVRAHQAARRAVSLVERAPPSLREVIRANALYQEGAYSQAIPLLEAVLGREPDLKEGLYILSQIYVHSARDGDTHRAIELMERLLELDPAFHLVYDRLALSYAFQGDFETAREKLRIWEDVRPDKVEGIRSVVATLEGQPEEALGFGQAFTWIEGPLFMASAAMLASRWDVALRMVALDPDEWRTEHLRAWSFRNQGTLYTYLGELDQAEQAYRQAGRAAGFRVHEGGAGGVPASALQSLAELLELRGDVLAARRESERALALQPESARGLYFAGRFALRDEDPVAAERYLGRLSALPAVSTSESIAIYKKALEAEIDFFRGRPEKARDKLEPLATSGSLLVDWASTCSSSGAAFRETLSRVYEALGEKEEASHALEELLASGFERMDHPALYVRALYALGVSKVESGDLDAGSRLLEKFLEHWGDSTWELPEVADARARLEKLR